MMDLKQVLADHNSWIKGENGKNGKRADFRGANLPFANLQYANLRRADFRGANLPFASLQYANLQDANLQDANLRDANLRYADLRDANLRYADLRGANLRYADLRGAIGNSREVKSLQVGEYPITYTADELSIGCQQHDIDGWWEFTDKEILEMDGKAALKWWRNWKPLLMQIIKTSPAEGAAK